jgi:hypothetical protein
MAEETPQPTPSEEARKAELEALFRQWERSSPVDAPATPEVPPRPAVRLRLLTTLGLLAVTVYVMASTWASVAYWLEPATPASLGDVRTRWARGETSLGAAPNSHVSVEGLIPSRLIAVTSDEPGEEVADDEIEYIFFCPLYNITVLTSQKIEIPGARMPIIEGDMERVVSTGLAFPADTLVRVSAAGRLLPGTEAPPNLRSFVAGYAKRLDLDVADTWVLVDGHTPASETLGVIVWGVAIVPPLVSLGFLLASLRRRARTGPLPPGAPIHTTPGSPS